MFKPVFFFGFVILRFPGVELYAHEKNEDSGIPPIERIRAVEHYEFLNENDFVKFF